MTAVIVHGSALSLSPIVAVLLMIPIVMVFAPQPVRRDKRTIVGLLLVLAAVIGAPAYAAVLNYCNGPLWYLMIECWF